MVLYNIPGTAFWSNQHVHKKKLRRTRKPIRPIYFSIIVLFFVSEHFEGTLFLKLLVRVNQRRCSNHISDSSNPCTRCFSNIKLSLLFSRCFHLAC
ncbi:hypothetical protein K450DRAFT_249793 [Umbelopsis ramanniana AG]|uniref:Uncharacterized protein n=1 Tax=Umbelopsis ramanniana AG TaxID=1314678 RepID=A0AAD5HB89_UMBRA|nr:uncharacterized protein K450DRAFT_249793 [Umbelopsis ramanniana AG]KAI8577890.1 hypothetical protein K450DRAFT_249793 [Umbelopsis ramanniana AG]